MRAFDALGRVRVPLVRTPENEGLDGIATLDGDVSSMVPPFVHQALRSKVTTLGDQQSPPNALRD